MKRRGFLSLLGLGGAGLLVGGPAVLAQARAKKGSPTTLISATWFMAEFAREFKIALAGHPTELIEGPCWQTAGDRSRYIELALNLRRPTPATDRRMDDMRTRYIMPAAHALAYDVRSVGMRKFYTPPDLVGTEACTRVWSELDGVALRGTDGYSRALRRRVFRVDVLGRA